MKTIKSLSNYYLKELKRIETTNYDEKIYFKINRILKRLGNVFTAIHDDIDIDMSDDDHDILLFTIKKAIALRKKIIKVLFT